MPTGLYFLRERALALMEATDSGWHAHRALQLTWGLNGDFYCEREGEPPASTRFAVLPPMQRHRIRGDASHVAYLFYDVGPRAWQAWRLGGGQVMAPDAAIRDGLHALAQRRDEPAAAALATRWSAQACPGLSSSAPFDGRIQKALDALERDPQAAWTHRSLADRAHLSPSRFQVLFREATGLPVRNYLLWRRLLEATQRLQAGASVTEAAHAAGFADAAHLSRSYRRIIGAAPSSLRT